MVVQLISWAMAYLGMFSGVEPQHSVAFMVIPFGVLCFWYWAVFAVAREARSDVVRDRPGWLFVAPPAFILIIGIAGWPTNNSPAAFAFFAILGVVLWFTAQALNKADSASGEASIWSILGAMVLLYVALLGVWGLAPRIRRVEARTAV